MSEEQRREYARIRMYEDQMDGTVFPKELLDDMVASNEPDRTDPRYIDGVKAKRDGEPRDMRQSVLWLRGWDEERQNN